ncbi:peptidoglycan-binding domain-containing protein [Streptomyces antibioticus]|uniref:peptidoglycan-binding domain-containing protein n=1 Tax=Streptomyces antibioticus TaxID=1890 RepID=UPI002258C940|nr:peptidoglycan-binding domain-containing protein [Streptomyces antibioticus]MCX4741572.1 peptidoglycan-binding protein [Streptomyces antibioticus]
MPTPAEPGREPDERPVLEPIRVLRPRNTDALAELFRELTEDTGSYEAVPVGDEATEELPAVPAGGTDFFGTDGAAPPAGGRHLRTGATFRRADGRRTRGVPTAPPGPTGTTGTGATREMARPRVPAPHPAVPARLPTAGSGAGLRRAAVIVAVAAAALVGFACALLLPARDGEAAAPAPAAPSPAATAPSPGTGTDPDGAGILREGDSGPEVTDLQQRLLRIPNVYDGGGTDGRYDTVLTEAVARFQLWYGIRGDEDGVYGDDTREALEARTATG